MGYLIPHYVIKQRKIMWCVCMYVRVWEEERKNTYEQRDKMGDD